MVWQRWRGGEWCGEYGGDECCGGKRHAGGVHFQFLIVW